jgi:nuclear transport factor 2 (NTF2) superfamily protein
MYTKEQQIRKAQKIGEHNKKRRDETKIMRAMGVNSDAWNNRKQSIQKRVFIQQGTAREIAKEKKFARMDSINRTGRM